MRLVDLKVAIPEFDVVRFRHTSGVQIGTTVGIFPGADVQLAVTS